jgi:Zn-dependent metalloprotease
MRRLIAVVVSLVVIGLTATSAMAASRPQAQSGLRLIAVRESLLGVHRWYEQTYFGLPVLGGFFSRHEDRTGRAVLLQDGRTEVVGPVAVKPSVPEAAARRVATRLAGGSVRRAQLSILPGARARLVWAVFVTPPTGTVRVLVDAGSGLAVRVERMVQEATGSGRVFHPNPVVTLRNQDLTDRNDADYGALQPAYRTVTLTDLDGSGYLDGRYAEIKLGNDEAFSTNNVFEYGRKDYRFEQVMAYHDVTLAQRYIQSLGFDNVNNEPQDLKPNAIPDDNSFYDTIDDSITLGTGGVDDAEDAEVTWHEYGHAIQGDQVPGFGLGHDAGSIGEGFGDYWAATMSQGISGNRDAPCVADWDATSYTNKEPHCLRRTDTDTTFLDQRGEVHHDGQMWSRALWDINRALGRTRANRVILEAQFAFCPIVLFSTAAQTTVNVARSLYGSEAAAKVERAFRDRGIIVVLEPPHVGCGVLPPIGV